MEGVAADVVAPNKLDVDEAPNGEEPNVEVLVDPKPVLPNAGDFGANGLLDGADDEKGFADDCPNVDDVANGFDWVLDAPKPTAPVD